jgi:hypothetical protein
MALTFDAAFGGMHVMMIFSTTSHGIFGVVLVFPCRFEIVSI